MENVLLLSADPWSFVDEKTGEHKAGVTLNYVTAYRDPGSNGLKPLKVTASSDVVGNLSQPLPAFAKLGFQTRPGAGGKVTVALVKMEIGQSLDIGQLFGTEAPKARPVNSPASAPAPKA